MKQKITQYIKSIANEKDIKILLACETGSRAWGFPSPDSDFDVRVIYMHKKDWYLSLSEQKDSIDLMYENNDIDISGWDLRKCLRLLQKSNAPLLERIQSPIIYEADDAFLKEFNALAKTQYSRIATIHHYLSMAKKFIDLLTEEPEYKLKKFFYALRSAVACKWILDTEEMPPIEFPIMLERLDIDEKLLKRIDELIAIKSTVSEGYMHQGESELIDFIKHCVASADKLRDSLPPARGSAASLDSFFIKTLNEHDY